MGWDVPAISGGYYQVAARRLLTQGYAPSSDNPK
jgi:hypothetical protein